MRGCLAGAGESDAEVVIGGTAESEELSAEHLRLLAPLKLAKAELSTIASLPSASYVIPLLNYIITRLSNLINRRATEDLIVKALNLIVAQP